MLINQSAYINAHIKLYGEHIIVNNGYWQMMITTMKVKKKPNYSNNRVYNIIQFMSCMRICKKML